MLKNAYLLAKIGADTTENEQEVAGTLQNFVTCPERRAVVSFFAAS